MEIIMESNFNNCYGLTNCISDCGCDEYNCGCDTQGDGGNDCPSYNPSYDDCLMGA